jgi:CPA2 family monovalent cation:H+ antiporter-2
MKDRTNNFRHFADWANFRMETWNIISHILILLVAALVLGTVATKLRQNAIIGYIFAGMIVGPNVLGIIETRKEMLVIAELGAALLLFNIGLDFSFRKLLRIGGKIYIGGFLQILITGLAGYIVALAMGAKSAASVAVGAAIAMSSTACVMKVLTEKTKTESVFGRYSIGILLFQDIALVPLVLLVSYLSGSQGRKPFLETAIFAVLAIAVIYLVLNKIAPLVLPIRSFSKHRDFPILFSIITALGAAWGAHRAGVSPTLGAFIAGMLLAQSPYSRQIKSDISSLSALLVTVFFTSIGMFGNPGWVVQNWMAVAGCVVAIILAKPLVTWCSLVILGFPKRISLATGVTIFQIGEFSFVIMAIASVNGLLDIYTFRLLISATVITLLMTPYMITFASWLAYEKPRKQGMPQAGPETAETSSGRAVIVVGFGPSGQRVMELLKSRYRQDLAMVDINAKNREIAERAKVEFHIGDATASGFLQEIGVETARALIVTIPDHNVAKTIISIFKNLAPRNAVVISRVRNQIFRDEFEKLGIEKIVDEEELTGDALGEAALEAIENS